MALSAHEHTHASRHITLFYWREKHRKAPKSEKILGCTRGKKEVGGKHKKIVFHWNSNTLLVRVCETSDWKLSLLDNFGDSLLTQPQSIWRWCHGECCYCSEKKYGSLTIEILTRFQEICRHHRSENSDNNNSHSVDDAGQWMEVKRYFPFNML